jgi:hypothetical protein
MPDIPAPVPPPADANAAPAGRLSILSALKALYQTARLYIALLGLLAVVPAAVGLLGERWGLPLWIAGLVCALPALLVLLWLVPKWREQQNRRRRRFAWIFSISAGIFVLLGILPTMVGWLEAPLPPATLAPAPVPPIAGSPAPAKPLPPPSSVSPPQTAAPGATAPVLTVGLLGSIASMATALAALIGLIFTSLLTWRKERRDAVLADLDLEKRRLENEKLRRDLESVRSDSKPYLDL